MHAITLPKQDTFLRDSTQILLGSMLIALSAQISFTIPFTAIPFSLQPHTVLFVASCLGPTRGVLCVIAYLLEGVMGLPVFTHGRSTIAHLSMHSGGYLLSYIPASYMMGYLMHRTPKLSDMGRFFAILGSSAVILCCGSLWLAQFVGGIMNGFMFGAIPFLIPDFFKCLALNSLFKSSK